MHNDYLKSFGTISTDELWKEIKDAANLFDFSKDGRGITTIKEMSVILNTEQQNVLKLKNAQNKKGAFEFNFEKLRKVPYSPQNIDEFQKKSEEFVKATAYKEKYENLTSGISEIKSIIIAENEYNHAKKYTKGPAAAALKPPKVSSHEKFGQVLLDFCNGDKELVNKYMSNLNSQMGSKEEIEKNYPKILNEIQQNCKKGYETQLQGKTYEQYTKDYETSFKKAFGGENVEQFTKGYIENQKMAAGYIETGIVIASSLLLPASGSFVKGSAALVERYGAKAAGQLLKAGMTTGIGMAPTVLAALSGATSEAGFTDEKKAEMLEKFKSGILYGGLGAYVSGPLGNAVEELIKLKPSVIPNVINKAFSNSAKVTSVAAKTAGAATETSADVILDMITNNGDIKSSLEQNGVMNFGMMIAGGRLAKLHKNVEGIKVEKTENNSYNVKDSEGKLLLKTQDENVLSAFIVGKAMQENTELPKANPEKPEAVIPKEELVKVTEEKIKPQVQEEGPAKALQADEPIKQPVRKDLSSETKNKIEEFGFDEDLKKQLIEILELSDEQTLDNTLKFIKKKQEKIGGDAINFDNTQIIDMIKMAQNSDNKINEKALKYINDNTRGGYSKFTQERIERLNMTKTPDGSFNEKALDLLVLSKYLKREDRNKIFAECKDTQGNFNEDLLDIAVKIDGESEDCSKTLELFDRIKNEDKSINVEMLNSVKKLFDDGLKDFVINKYIDMSTINGKCDLDFLNGELVPKINEMSDKGYSMFAIYKTLEMTKDNNGNIRPNSVDDAMKAYLETPEGQKADIKRLVNLRIKENPDDKGCLEQFKNAEYFAEQGDTKVLNEFKELIYIEGRDTQLKAIDIYALLIEPRRERKKVNIEGLIKNGLHKNIEGRKSSLNVKELIELSGLDNNTLTKIADRGLLKDIPERSKVLTMFDVKQLVKMKDDAWKNTCERGLLTKQIDGEFLTCMDIPDIASMSNDAFKNVEDRNLLSICKERISHNGIIDKDTLRNLSKISDADWNKLIEIGVLDEKTNKFRVSAKSASGFSNLTPEQIQRLKDFKLLEYLDSPKKIEQESFATLWLARLNDEAWQNVVDNNLLTVKVNEGEVQRNLRHIEICDYAKLNKDEWNNVIDRNLTSLKLKDKYLSTSSVMEFAKIDNESWNNIAKRDLFNKEISDRDIVGEDGSTAMYVDLDALRNGTPLGKAPRKLSGSEIILLSQLNDTQYKQTQDLFDIPGRIHQLGVRDIAILAKEDSSVLNKIKERGLLTTRYNNGSEIIRLANLDGEHWNRAKSLIQHRDSGYNSLKADEVIVLSKMSDENWKNLMNRKLLDADNGNLDKDALLVYSSLDDKSWNNIAERKLFELTEDYNGQDRHALIAKFSEQPLALFDKLNDLKVNMKENNTKYGNLKFYDLAEAVLNPEKVAGDHISKRIEVLSFLSKLDDKTRTEMETSGIKVGEVELLIAGSLGKRRDVINTPEKFDFLKEVISNNNAKNEKIIKEFDFAQFEKRGIPLKYSRKEFIKDLDELLRDLPLDEQQKVLKYFGISKTENGFEGILNNKNIEDNMFSNESRIAANKIKEKIEDFTFKNEVDDSIINEFEVKEILNGLIKGLPEFTSVIGKEQHGTHAYSVDVHTLKVLQTAMNNPLYKQLTDQDKTVLKMSILLHDLGKKEGVIDTGHATLSSDYTLSILDKFKLPSTVKDRIVDIVDNHHWFEGYNTGKISAEDVATRCRRPQDFKISEIFAQADFENVNKLFHYERTQTHNAQEYKDFMSNKMQPIQEALNKLYSKSNIVFDTQFTQANKKFPTMNVNINGNMTELRVLNLTDKNLNADLFEYGFAPGTTKETARFTVHMVDNNNMNTKMSSVDALLNNPRNQSTWSTSLISLDNNRTYSNRRFGFVLDVDQANISEANFANTGSGTEKNINNFKHILFENNNKARTFVRDNFLSELTKKGINLTDAEYGELVEYLSHKKYTTQIKDFTTGDKTIKAQDLVEVLETSRDKLFDGGDIHSEIVPINPRVKGLVARVTDINHCPLEFLNFAKEHNLPIILIGFKGST